MPHHDPEHIAYMIHLTVESLRARLRNEPGFNYLGRLNAAVAADASVSPASLPARDLANDVRTLRALANELDAARKRLTRARRSRSINPFKIAAE